MTPGDKRARALLLKPGRKCASSWRHFCIEPRLDDIGYVTMERGKPKYK
jgi:hypothetical protein